MIRFVLAVLLTAAMVSAGACTAAVAAPDDPGLDKLREEVAALKAMVLRLSNRVEDQERTIRELRASAAPVPAGATGAAPAGPASAGAPAEGAPGPAPVQGPPPPAEAPAAVAGPAPAGASSPASNYFNPSISVIGNFLSVAGHNAVDNLPNAELRESEVGLQAIVDPYARADFFLSFGEGGVDVEEGYATFTELPWDLLAKVGRTRTAFGKINALHLHVLPWPDEPLPVVNLLGSADGWIGTGVTVARLIPLPGGTFSELTLQAMRADAGTLFTSQQRHDLAYNAHYRLFRDVTEATNVDLGFSYARGPNGTAAGQETRLSGVDVTVRIKPLRTATYRSTVLRGEYVRSRRDEPGGDQSAAGWFASGEYQLAKRWFAGARLEAADHGDDASHTDRGKAILLTFWPSEFSQLRGELRRRVYFDRTTANELLLQLQFAIGAHGAHPF